MPVAAQMGYSNVSMPIPFWKRRLFVAVSTKPLLIADHQYEYQRDSGEAGA
jgi:hypothetical protein